MFTSVQLVCISVPIFSEFGATINSSWLPNPPNFKVKYEPEVESTVPVFCYSAYHFSVKDCYQKLQAASYPYLWGYMKGGAKNNNILVIK